MKLMTVAGVVLMMMGCAATPHVFQSEWSEEKLPRVASMKGDNAVTGSAFLRQGGGGTVTCAGNDVILTSRIAFSRSDYAREVHSLRGPVRHVSTIDPRHSEFEAKLSSLNASRIRRTRCDVDGKFRFSNLAPGRYQIKTRVYWVVGGEGQGGIVSRRIVIPDGSRNASIDVVISQMAINQRQDGLGSLFTTLLGG